VPFCAESIDQCVECLEAVNCDDEDPCNGIEDCVDYTCAAGPITDCNGNGYEDYCDVNAGTSEDCNINDVPDECDIAEGTSQDDNGNGRPDECDLPIPAASEWGILVMGLLMLAAGTLVFKRSGLCGQG
jgi:hypothetical protein